MLLRNVSGFRVCQSLPLDPWAIHMAWRLINPRRDLSEGKAKRLESLSTIDGRGSEDQRVSHRYSPFRWFWYC